MYIRYTVLIEIIVFPSLYLNKNASLLMIRNDVFTGTVSASTSLSTQISVTVTHWCYRRKICSGRKLNFFLLKFSEVISDMYSL